MSPSLESLEIIIVVKINHDTSAWRRAGMGRRLRRGRRDGRRVGGQCRQGSGMSRTARSMADTVMTVQATGWDRPSIWCWERPERVCLRSHGRPVLRARLDPRQSRPTVAGCIDLEEVDLVLQAGGL
jgi:hypothetical protein